MRLTVRPTLSAPCHFITENVHYASKGKRGGGLLNLGRSYELIVSRERNTADFRRKALFRSNQPICNTIDVKNERRHR